MRNGKMRSKVRGVLCPSQKKSRSLLRTAFLLYKGYEKDIFRELPLGFEPNEKIQRGRLTKEDAVGYSCTNSKKSPFDQL